MKERKSRPLEINTRQLVKLNGTFRKGKDVHEYKIPNNPDNNEWYNLSLEDIGFFWDLPNVAEQKYYYFHCVNLGKEGENKYQENSGIAPCTIDELVELHYEWRTNEKANNLLQHVFGVAAVFSFLGSMWAI